MIVIVLLLCEAVRRVVAVNPCHSDCKPYRCHGPLSTQCEECPSNMRLVMGTCACKVGWFNKPGAPCSVFNYDCIQGTMDQFYNVYCSKCEHGVNGPVAGVCQGKPFDYSNARVENTYNPGDIFIYQLLFANSGCNALNEVGTTRNFYCDSCRKNYYYTSVADISCNRCPLLGCYECAQTAAATCTSGCGDGLYLSAGVCNYCFLSCRRCSGKYVDECSECKPGFYWTKNAYNQLGICVPCNSKCKTCFGPGETDCAEVAGGYYVQNYGLLTNTTTPCPSTCGECDNTGKCTTCKPPFSTSGDEYIYDEVTGLCESKPDMFFHEGCLDLLRHANGDHTCQKCGFKKYNNTFSSSECPQNYLACSYSTMVKDDPRQLACEDCGPLAYIVSNKDHMLCDYFDQTDTDGCLTGISLSGKYHCTLCDVNYYLNPNTGYCLMSCPANHAGLNYTQDVKDMSDNVIIPAVKVCYELPIGCLAGEFTAAKEFNCTLCDVPNGYLKYQVTDLYCISIICNNVRMGPNKPCNPISSPSTCDPNICFWTNDAADCTGGTCIRNMFKLEFEGLNFQLKVNEKYDFYLDFDVQNYVVYEWVSNTEKKIFCRLISDDLNDDLSTCIYSNGVIKIETISSKYLQLISTGFITLKKQAFKIFRTRLSLDGVDINDPASIFNFNFALQVPLDTTSSKSSNWEVQYQPQMIQQKGLVVNVEQLTDKFGLISMKWKAVTVRPNNALVSQLSSLLPAFDNKNLNVPIGSNFINQTIELNLVIKDDLNQTQVQTIIFDVVTGNYALELAIPGPIMYNEGENVYIPFVSSIPGLIPSQVLIISSGPPESSTFEASLERQSMQYILTVKAKGADFWITLNYPNYISTAIRMIRARPYYPSLAIYESFTDNKTSFVAQILSRKPSFVLHCIDEAAMKPCLQPKTLYIGDQISVGENFNYTTEGPKVLFLRVGAGTLSETVTSLVINTKQGQNIKTPLADNRQSISYPEGPFFTQNDPFNSYLDFKYSNISEFQGLQCNYLDHLLSKKTGTFDFEIDSSQKQLNYLNDTRSNYKLNMQVQVKLGDDQTHSLTESKFISRTQTTGLMVEISEINGYLQADFTAKVLLVGLCNDAAGSFNTMFKLDNRIYIAENGLFIRKRGIPAVFSSVSVPVKSTVYSYCGPIESSERQISETSGLQLSSSLSTYVTYMLANLGLTSREKLNSLNFLALQLSLMYRQCVTNSQCLATKAEIVNETSKLLGGLSSAFENNKYSITLRYSFLNGLLNDTGLIGDTTLEKVIEKVEAVSSHITDSMEIPLHANNRLSRALRVQVSALDLIQADLVDYPLMMSSNMLDKFLFSYFNDSRRNETFNRTINQIVRFMEFKLLRFSSHKRKEEYRDDNIFVQGMTVMSPLETDYPFQLNSTTMIIFKNLKFETEELYYEFIVIYWPNSLLDRMKPVYNESTNEFQKKAFYYTFTSFFEKQIPISGEVQVHSKECSIVNLTGCTPNEVPHYSMCYCILAPTRSGSPPTADYEPQKPATETPTSKTPTLQDLPKILAKPDSKILDPTRMHNYKVWSYSTLILESLFLLLYGLCLFFSGWLNMKAAGFCGSFSLKILFHQIQAIPKHLQKSVSAETLELSNESSNDMIPETFNLEQKTFAKKVKKLTEEGKCQIDVSKITAKELEKFTFWSFYQRFVNLNHMCSALACLKSMRYKKTTLISMAFLRLIVHLAISMYFTLCNLMTYLAVEMKIYSENQQWILKAIIIPVPLHSLFWVLRKTMAGQIPPEEQPVANQSIFYLTLGINKVLPSPIQTPTPIQKKLGISTVPRTEKNSFNFSPSGSPQIKSRVSRTRPGSTKTNIALDYSVPDIEDDGAAIGDNRISRNNHRKRTISFDNLPRQDSQDLIRSVPDVTPSVKPWEKPWIKNTFGYILLSTVFVGSIYVIFFISVTSSNSRAWPWGFWYIISLMIDQILFQPMFSIIVAFLAFRHINSGKEAGGVSRWLIGVDILSVLDRHKSLAKEFV